MEVPKQRFIAVSVNKRLDAIQANLRGGLPSYMELREETISHRNPDFKNRYWHAVEWYANPGQEGVIQGSTLIALERDGKDREIKLYLHEIPGQLMGTWALLTFVPKRVVVLTTEIVVIPEIGTLKAHQSAPKTSACSRITTDGIIEGLTQEESRNKDSIPPLNLAFPWINPNASIGPVVVYGDANGQGIALYYQPDFNASIAERRRILTASEANIML